MESAHENILTKVMMNRSKVPQTSHSSNQLPPQTEPTSHSVSKVQPKQCKTSRPNISQLTPKCSLNHMHRSMTKRNRKLNKSGSSRY